MDLSKVKTSELVAELETREGAKWSLQVLIRKERFL